MPTTNRMTYRCEDCELVYVTTNPNVPCLKCGGKLIPDPDAAINFEIALTSANRVKRWSELKKIYQQEAGK